MKKSEFVLLALFRGAKTQKELAEKLGISLSTVNNAIKPLSRIGAIEVRKFGLKIVDREKALTFWASSRNILKDIIYQTRVENSVANIERLMPSGVVFSAFSAFRFRFNETPADYSEVYVYADEGELLELKKRFPPGNGPPNILVLKKEGLFLEEKIVPNELLFVDLWNLGEWYAKEFLTALKQKMGLQ